MAENEYVAVRLARDALERAGWFVLEEVLVDLTWRLVHGSPRLTNEYLFEDRDPRSLARIAQGADTEVLVFGHTHKPWIREYGGVLFVNCGSVGKPKDGDPRSAFALLSANGNGVDVEIPRVDYPMTGVAEEMKTAGLPPELAEKLVTAV